MWYSNRNLSIFVEKCLYSEVEKIESRVKDTSEMLTIIDNLNKSNTLTSDCRLVSFDIINMFHSIDNISGLEAVKSILDPTKKFQFTMEVATDTLEFLDLKLKFDEEYKQISADVFAKHTDSFIYVLPSTCFPENNIENIHKGVALRLRRICYSDEKLEKDSAEYQNYLIARDYKPGKNNFQTLKNLLEKR